MRQRDDLGSAGHVAPLGVRIDQPGQHHLALPIKHLRVRLDVALQAFRGAHASEEAVLGFGGLRPLGGGASKDARVGNDEVTSLSGSAYQSNE